MEAARIKANGIHYTPPELAHFLARLMVENIAESEGEFRVLDPACGDGALLRAFANSVPDELRTRLVLVGYDTCPTAIATADDLLRTLGVRKVILNEADFLDSVAPPRRTLFDDREPQTFDAIISNPPYVRTQVLGAKKAQALAEKFDLKGRVDLYHAFALAMASMLRQNGILGLLTSNRFLTVRSGATLRNVLNAEFELLDIFDLGDTKLFSAAVLPAIVIGRRTNKRSIEQRRFNRIYVSRGSNLEATAVASVIDAVRDRKMTGLVAAATSTYRIERGTLLTGDSGSPWSLSTADYRDWLSAIDAAKSYTFEEVAHIRVGIKTTADDVFIREDWASVPETSRPESELMRPLIRHFDADRWFWSENPRQSVVYPHTASGGRKVAVCLAKYPRTERYFDAHRERLERRKYVSDAGRRWYEIWVSHNPDDWSRPKVVFPDIAEEPRFFLDSSGAVVNGDCYWMTLRKGFTDDFLLLILAVANSTFITKFYDVTFHNKLYAGRRRFMTQYVKQFPLPDIASPATQRLLQAVSELIRDKRRIQEQESAIDDLVWQSFGLSKEVGG